MARLRQGQRRRADRRTYDHVLFPQPLIVAAGYDLPPCAQLFWQGRNKPMMFYLVDPVCVLQCKTAMARLRQGQRWRGDRRTDDHVLVPQALSVVAGYELSPCAQLVWQWRNKPVMFYLVNPGCVIQCTQQWLAFAKVNAGGQTGGPTTRGVPEVAGARVEVWILGRRQTGEQSPKHRLS